MADKTPKFIDIKSPEKATPSATSRPIVVSNRSVLGKDPMVSGGDDGEEGKTGVPITRTAKTIKPVSADLVSSESDEKQLEPEEAAAETSASDTADDTKQLEADPAKQDAAPPAEPEAEPVIQDNEEPDVAVPLKRDAAAESHADKAKIAAEAAAAEARQNELESLIASGKFNAPINAHRKRSRSIIVSLVVLILILLIGIADAALDAGLLTFEGVPHTDILQDK